MLLLLKSKYSLTKVHNKPSLENLMINISQALKISGSPLIN